MEKKYRYVNGRLVVKNALAPMLPTVQTTLKSGKTTYRFNGSYDGIHSISAKILRLMEKDGEKGDEKPGNA
ncbi:MAG: hypothetical protein LBV27_01090 [Oscillospiraceae bacterium]|nr:hypothetical protein [Oscillospiraceae bacterium]